MFDDVIIPIEIDYNRLMLNDYVESIDTWPEYISNNTILEHKDILFPLNSEAYRIKTLLHKSTTYSFSCVPPHTETGFHSDSNRGCTLILPIDMNPHLIKFKIDKEIKDYLYYGPVITNAKSIHNGVNETDMYRFNLLFHFDESYEEIRDLAFSNKLVSSWKQAWPIDNQTSLQCIDDYFNPTGEGIIIKHIESSGNTCLLVDGRHITYSEANNYDLIMAIKYLLENKRCLRLDLI